MRRLRDKLFVSGWRRFAGMLVLTMLGAGSALAQPANDNFANATTLTSSALWGSITNDNTGATAEAGEPAHSSLAATHSVWFKWVAPQDGEAVLDTMGSSFDSLLAVYTGNSIANLSQVAANDDLYPTRFTPGSGSQAQFNNFGMMSDDATLPPDPGLTFPDLASVPFFNISANLWDVSQPYSGLPGTQAPGSGASGLRFNAKAGVAYYIAVDGKDGFLPGVGPFTLSWAYHSSGVLKFASEVHDQTTGVPGMLMYQVAETEEFSFRKGTVDAAQYDTTFNTVYTYGVSGVLVTVTRVGGSSGRVTVDYATVGGDSINSHYSLDPVNGLVGDGTPIPLSGDAPAVPLTDYTPVSGTLTFNDFEMSKTIVIPIVDDFGKVQHNRDFSVVLFNEQRDPLEDASVSPPRLDTFESHALVRILDCDIDPRGGSLAAITITNQDPITLSNSVTTNYVVALDSTNAIFNFLRSNFCVFVDVADYWGNTPITVYVGRYGTNSQSASISYRINSDYLSRGNSLNNEFPLLPGSDYANSGSLVFN